MRGDSLVALGDAGSQMSGVAGEWHSVRRPSCAAALLLLRSPDITVRATREIDPSQRKPDDANWTGAEIKACCRLAALLDLPLVQAAQNVVPVAVTSVESVERLRNWASGRCLSADRAGMYRREPAPAGTRRKVNRDVSAN